MFNALDNIQPVCLSTYVSAWFLVLVVFKTRLRTPGLDRVRRFPSFLLFSVTIISIVVLKLLSDQMILVLKICHTIGLYLYDNIHVQRYCTQTYI